MASIEQTDALRRAEEARRKAEERVQELQEMERNMRAEIYNVYVIMSEDKKEFKAVQDERDRALGELREIEWEQQVVPASVHRTTQEDLAAARAQMDQLKWRLRRARAGEEAAREEAHKYQRGLQGLVGAVMAEEQQQQQQAPHHHHHHHHHPQLAVLAALPQAAAAQQQEQEQPRAHPRRRATTCGWGTIGAMAAGLGGLLVLVLALLATTTTTTTTPGVEPVAFSGTAFPGTTSVITAIAAMGRQAGYQAGLAMRAEDAVGYWRFVAFEEKKRREAAEQQASTLRAQLFYDRKELSDARQTVDRLEYLYRSSEQQRHAAERALSQEEHEKALVLAERDDVKARLTLVEAELSQTEASLAGEQAKTQHLEGELTGERAAVGRYRERLEAELSARQGASDLAYRLTRDLLDVRDQLAEARSRAAACDRGFRSCQTQRQQAQERADSLLNDKHFACVGWMADLASRVKAAVLSPARGPPSPDIDTFAASTSSSFTYSYSSKM